MPLDSKPLTGKRVVITRAAHQAEGLARHLRDYGAEIVLCPMLAMAQPADPAVLPNALRTLASFDMMIVLSANGANAIHTALRDNEIEVPAPGAVEVLAVGPATADVLRETGFNPQTPAGAGSAIRLFEAIVERVQGRKILVVQSEDNDDLLAGALSRVGADVVAVDGYKSEIPQDADENLCKLFTPEFNAHVVTFASGRMGTNFYSVLERNGRALPDEVLTVSIGPQTTASLQAIGKPPKLQAAETTAKSMADVIAQWYRGGG